MFLEFERVYKTGYIFQKSIIVNMDKVTRIKILRSTIYFYFDLWNCYGVPKTDKNVKILKAFFKKYGGK